MATLHITNGDSVIRGLRMAGVPGDFWNWAEVLHEGPAPLVSNHEEWLEIRARFHAECDFGSFADCLSRLRRRDAVLDRCTSYDEVILWFEHDLFDQLILIQLLDALAGRDLGETKLGMICINQFPGAKRFLGLGVLSPQELASLAGTQKPVTPAELALGQEAWYAFRSENPHGIEVLANARHLALPFLAAAFRRHLEQFPSVVNGLGRTERQALALLESSGPMKGAEVFARMYEVEESPFLGDKVFWQYLDRLADEPHPLLSRSTESTLEIATTTVSLTDQGRDVLAGRRDAVALRGLNRWLGGVHLSGLKARWRWDTVTGRLVGPEF